MNIRVEYVAQMRQAANLESETVSVAEGASPAGLVADLAARHGDRFRTIAFDAAGALRPSILVFVGDEQIDPGEVRALRDGDRVTLLAPLAGG